MHELPSIEDGYLKVASDPIVFERDESVASNYIHMKKYDELKKSLRPIKVGHRWQNMYVT